MCDITIKKDEMQKAEKEMMLLINKSLYDKKMITEELYHQACELILKRK